MGEGATHPIARLARSGASNCGFQVKGTLSRRGRLFYASSFSTLGARPSGGRWRSRCGAFVCRGNSTPLSRPGSSSYPRALWAHGSRMGTGAADNDSDRPAAVAQCRHLPFESAGFWRGGKAFVHVTAGAVPPLAFLFVSGTFSDAQKRKEGPKPLFPIPRSCERWITPADY